MKNGEVVLVNDNYKLSCIPSGIVRLRRTAQPHALNIRPNGGIYIFIILSIGLFLIGCKPEPCEPEIRKVDEDLYSYLPDIYHSTFYYKNSNSEYLTFNLSAHGTETVLNPNNTCQGTESFSLVQTSTNNPASRIRYSLKCNSRNISFNIGPDNCESLFFFNVDSLNKYTYFDTLTLNNEVFFSAYYKVDAPFMCCTEIYYNTKYGVVGFNWQGEWYVLETDSL